MANIPQDKSLDSTLDVLREGFNFIHNRCKQYQSDVFQTRLLLQKVICLHGEEGSRLFYDNERFIRKGAAPKRVQKTLFGQRGVQTLDDAAHRHRKAMFMSLMGPESIEQLMDAQREQWRAAIRKWEKMDHLVLFNHTQEILCRAACQWTGVPLPEADVKKRTLDFVAMVDAFGAVGPRHWRGRVGRMRTESWISEFIEAIRSGKQIVREGTPAHVMAFHRDPDGQLLDTQVAAVELINLIRPIVAISWYIAFAALALHQYPETRRKLREGYAQGKPDYALMFVQEVRRFYPFGPFLGARVRQAFDWKGFHFDKGMLVLLDIYGTHHDARLWEHPDEFRPERFLNWTGNPFDFIPQGGGDHYTGHRCAGEWITIETTKLALHFLVNEMSYQVPEQDLSFSLTRMPTFPRTGVVISRIRSVEPPRPAESPASLPQRSR
jgi:fatty-acid peroxygenase